MAEGNIAQNEALDPSKIIPFISDHVNLTWTCVFACISVIIAAFFYKYTVTGFNMMAAGENPKAAEAGGIRINYPFDTNRFAHNKLDSGFGKILSGYTGLVYILILIMLLTWIVIYKTSAGNGN